MAEETENKAKSAKKRSGIVQAQWLSTKFFSRHWGIILAFVLLVLVYITNRYQCITAMETIQSLEKELQIVRSERVRERSEYMSATREAEMQKLVRQSGLNLEIREQPPFILQVNE